MYQTSRNVTYSAHCTSTTGHGKYTQASTWLLKVACLKYVKSIWKGILNGVFRQIHLLTKSIKNRPTMIPNTQFAVFQIPNTNYIN